MIAQTAMTVEEGHAAVAAAYAALDDGKERVEACESRVSELYALVQAAPFGSQERDQAITDHRLAVDRLDFARGDLVPLQTAINAAETQRGAALYEDIKRQMEAVAFEAETQRAEIAAIDAQIAALETQRKARQDEAAALDSRVASYAHQLHTMNPSGGWH